MNTNAEEKLFLYVLRALSNGNYNFLKIDQDDREAPAQLCLPDMTVGEIRECYRTNWSLSDAQIDARINAARRKLGRSGNK
jgi:hypothetical protein